MSDFYVGIKELPEGTQVQFSPFPQGLITNFRPVAEINIKGPGEVKLDIYLDQNETATKKEVKVYKEDPDTKVRDWKKAKNQSDVKEDKKIKKWKGYIELVLKEGDPPIAVG